MISLFCLQVGQTIYKNFPSLDFGNLHFYLEFLIKFFNNKKNLQTFWIAKFLVQKKKRSQKYTGRNQGIRQNFLLIKKIFIYRPEAISNLKKN